MFYNSIYFRGDDLNKAWEDTRRQEDMVLHVFQTNSTKKLTPSEVWDFFNNQGYKWPLTSIRRAITDLTNDGKLTKLDDMKKGIYGKPEFMWELKQRPKLTPGTLF